MGMHLVTLPVPMLSLSESKEYALEFPRVHDRCLMPMLSLSESKEFFVKSSI
jgi:hypothetical protein